MRRIALALVVLCVWASGGVQAQGLVRPSTLLLAAQVGTSTVTASWTANPTTDMVVDYRLYYGLAPATYTLGPIDVAAPAVSVVVPGLVPGTTYYFALQARGAVLLSALSTEVAFTVPIAADPNCAFPLGADAIGVFPTALQYSGSSGPGSGVVLSFDVASPASPITQIGVTANGVFMPVPAGSVNPMNGPNLQPVASFRFVVPTTSGTYPLAVWVNNAYGCARTQSTAFSVTVP